MALLAIKVSKIYFIKASIRQINEEIKNDQIIGKTNTIYLWFLFMNRRNI
jgi:hypothetical protein